MLVSENLNVPKFRRSLDQLNRNLSSALSTLSADIPRGRGDNTAERLRSAITAIKNSIYRQRIVSIQERTVPLARNLGNLQKALDRLVLIRSDAIVLGKYLVKP